MTTILIDADFIDQLAFELTVNFERMLERRVQKLDIAHWVDCLMLDAQNDLGFSLGDVGADSHARPQDAQDVEAGLNASPHDAQDVGAGFNASPHDAQDVGAGFIPARQTPSVQVIFLYTEGKEALRNCQPAHLDTDLNATATQTRIAEYLFASNKVEPSLTTMGDLFCESLGVLLRDEKTDHILLVGDLWAYGDKLKQELRHAPHPQNILLFTAGDAQGFRCPQEMLSYSLMAAMGIRGEELG